MDLQVLSTTVLYVQYSILYCAVLYLYLNHLHSTGCAFAVAQMWAVGVGLPVPQAISCRVTTALGLSAWNLMFTSLLLKAIRIWRVMRASLRGEKSVAFTSRAAVIVQFVLAALVEVRVSVRHPYGTLPRKLNYPH